MQLAVRSQSCPGFLSSCRKLPLVVSRTACWGEGRNLEELSTGTDSWARPQIHVGNPYKYQKNKLTYSSAPQTGFTHWLNCFSRRHRSPPAGRNTGAQGGVVGAKHRPGPAP